MTQGDTKRPRSVKAEFDSDFNATANGGAILCERTMRSLGLRRYIKKYLPPRSEDAFYSTEEAAYALMSALAVGSKGIGATQGLCEDGLLSCIFGLVDGAPSASTVHRLLCDLSGLPVRKAEEVYEPAGSRLAALDMFGDERKKPQRRRVVPDEPEAAAPERLAALERFFSRMAVRCAKAIGQKSVRVHGWHALFGDATDLEVEGHCFDAARVGRDGEKAIRWLTLMVGSIVLEQCLLEGNTDEGLSMPALLKKARSSVREVAGAMARVLGLFDAAYFEKQVCDLLTDVLHWDFIVCANQQRGSLTRLAEERPVGEWQKTGADASRGWSASEVCCFTHLPKDWNSPVTIVARRWQKADEIQGLWHYSFLATRIEPGDLPKKLTRRGYCQAIWMLYGTKQGRENHYKTALRDFGLHHPPSGRLGLNQAFYALATTAANIAMVMRYRVVPQEDRGISFWRLRERYFRIAGRVVSSARRLTVYLAGANVDAQRQVLWKEAFAAAGRL